MNKKTVFIIYNLFFLVPLFSQTVSFEQAIEDFADAVNPTLPFVANMGLNWSTPYVGQLIGYPMHFGVGVFVGSSFMDNTEAAALGENLGITIDESVIKGKQWFPNYAVTARIGGFGGIPLDFGFKVGYLPNTALWGSLDYNSMLLGADVHYALYMPDKIGTVVAIGLGYDYLKGTVTGEVASTPPAPSVTQGMPAYIYWESNTIKAQAFISQPLAATIFTFFGSIDAGFGINKAGVKIGDDVDNPAYENVKDVSSILVSGSVGVGIELKAFRIDASFMWNFINFESGVGIGFRYQQ